MAKMTNNVPKLASSEWPHKPVFFQAMDGTNCTPSLDFHTTAETTSETEPSCNTNTPLPIGIPIPFTTDLFEGQILFRLKNGKSDDALSQSRYFSGRQRVRQYKIQGRFKDNGATPRKLSEVYAGDIYSQPLGLKPPPFIHKIIIKIMKQAVPGVIMDLLSDSPKVLALSFSGAQTIRIDLPGTEPDIMDIATEEDTSLLFGTSHPTINVHDSAKRRTSLSNPNGLANEYSYNPEHVYTFDFYDNLLDLGLYTLNMPVLGAFDMTRTLGGQPMSISMMVKDPKQDKDGNDQFQYVFGFRVWHERLLPVGRQAQGKAHAAAGKPKKKTERDEYLQHYQRAVQPCFNI
mmetsp:Transcript_32497/g.37639  ORF Transcript_32497/g.37639 Transcript_32497/m.37639 type:complete len:346 (+) Transcript_32497:44-1081(+)